MLKVLSVFKLDRHSYDLVIGSRSSGRLEGVVSVLELVDRDRFGDSSW